MNKELKKVIYKNNIHELMHNYKSGYLTNPCSFLALNVENLRNYGRV